MTPNSQHIHLCQLPILANRTKQVAISALGPIFRSIRPIALTKVQNEVS